MNMAFVLLKHTPCWLAGLNGIPVGCNQVQKCRYVGNIIHFSDYFLPDTFNFEMRLIIFIIKGLGMKKNHSFLLKIILTLLMLLIFGVIPLSAAENFYFDHLGTEDGLSMNNVNAIVRDKTGFVWIGTEDGLNRFDGYDFVVYHNQSEDPQSISSNYIIALLYDSKDRLWVTTREGLCRYLPEQDAFVRYPTGGADSTQSLNAIIQSLYEDPKGNIWAGGEKGVDCLNPETGMFRHYAHDANDSSSLNSETIYDVEADSKGRIWVATENGLDLMDPETGRCQHYLPDPKNPNSICARYIRSLLIDEKDNIWIGTYENGLNYFDTANQRFIHFPHIPGYKHSLSHYQVNDLAFHWDGNLLVATTEGLNYIELNKESIDRSKIYQYLEDPNDNSSLSASHIQNLFVEKSRVWLATRFGGVNIYNLYGSKFRKFSTVSRDGNGLSHSNVTSFAEDNRGIIYIGTDGGGLNIYDRNTGKFAYMTHDPYDPNTLSNDKVLAVCYDPPSTIWAGTWSGGLNRIDLKTGAIKRYKHDPHNSKSLSNDNIYYLFLDHKRRLWVGTWSSGLNRYDRATDSFIRYPFNTTDGTGLSGETVISIYEDKQYRLWMATEGQGLDLFDEQNNRFVYFQHQPDDQTTISSNYVIGTLQDNKGRFWVTTTSGLNLFDPQTGKFQSFDERDGLPAQTLYGLLEDGAGNLWVSSIKGLSKIKVTERDSVVSIYCNNYSPEDGLQGDQYGQWAYFKSLDKTMFFGGLSGFNMFHPDEIRKNPTPPTVLINGFQLGLKPVSFKAPKSPLIKPIYLTDEIILSHKEHMLTFEFVGISFTQPENNQYAYLLENFDKEQDWHYSGTERKATYTNLDPGEYVFRVKGANNDGIWNTQGASLKIIIPPPFWRRPWFIVLTILAGSGMIYYIYKMRVRAIEAQRQKLESEIDERTAELEKKSDEINESYKMLSETGAAVAFSSRMVNKATSQIRETMQEVLDGTMTQTEFVAKTNELITSLLLAIRSVSAKARNSRKAAEKTVTAVESSIVSMQSSLDTIHVIENNSQASWVIMERLMEHSAQIDQIVRFIDDVASRVNVLALNALIEATNAGEHGRGFLIVAQEIRDLAKRATNSTLEITEFITKIQGDVNEIEKVTRIGMEEIKRTAKITSEGRAVLNQITKSVVQEKERLVDIADKVVEMQNFSRDVQQAIDRVSTISDKNLVNVEKVNKNTNEVGARIEELSKLAQTLDGQHAS